MYSIDGYTAYADHLVPVRRWPDPNVTFATNESFYDLERSDNNIVTNDNIYKSNEFNESTSTSATNAYSNRTSAAPAHASSYLFIPFYGALQQNPATASLIWQQNSEGKRSIGGFLSTDAIPFIPSKSETSKQNPYYLFIKWSFFYVLISHGEISNGSSIRVWLMKSFVNSIGAIKVDHLVNFDCEINEC